ncbi:MAG: AAA-like domain-containing protein [Coleofasciculus sp. C1-SOL-03]|jgi:hypothetical protein|uniref:AAA-like domain-containing protein n=1 Tax=Coleofasciculus sp. C1-SOL-03 TaxID=3069522 RepID=UPI0033026EE3
MTNHTGNSITNSVPCPNNDLQEALTSSEIYNGHLRRLASLITTPQLADAVRQVMGADETVLKDSFLAYKLNSLGLIKLKDNKATPSCELYRQYFGAGRGSS